MNPTRHAGGTIARPGASEPPTDDAEAHSLELIATLPTTLDAWAIKWTLKAEGILAFLGGAATSGVDVYVLRSDVARALEVLSRDEEQLEIA